MNYQMAFLIKEKSRSRLRRLQRGISRTTISVDAVNSLQRKATNIFDFQDALDKPLPTQDTGIAFRVGLSKEMLTLKPHIKEIMWLYAGYVWQITHSSGMSQPRDTQPRKSSSIMASNWNKMGHHKSVNPPEVPEEKTFYRIIQENKPTANP